eukprot:jgi/Antlo1/2296/1181
MKWKHALDTALDRTKHVLLTAMLAVFYATHLPLMIALGVLSELVFCKTAYRGKFVYALRIVWIEATMAMLGCYFRRKIVLAYHKELVALQRCLVISNHLTNYDWIFLLRVLYHLGKFGDLCVVLKESLGRIPVFGRGMKIFGFIFLKRSLDKDKIPIQNGLAELCTKPSFTLLFFPEGTIIDKETHRKSRLFARRIGAVLNGEHLDLEEVLAPRTSGYEIINNAISDRIQGIVDTTLLFNPYRRYPQSTFSYRDIFLGECAETSFILVMDIAEKGIIIREDAFLYSLFTEKDMLIRKYARDLAHNRPVGFAHFKSFCMREHTAGSKLTFTEIPLWTKYSLHLLSGTLFLWVAVIFCVLRSMHA